MKLRDFARGQDEPALVQLRAAVWGQEHPHNSAAFFEWLFSANPEGEGGGVVLEENSQLTGFAGLATRKMQVEGQLCQVALGMDYMIHPQFRNGFGASRLVNGWLKSVSQHSAHYAFGLCYPNMNSYKILTGKKLAWQPVCELRMMIRPLGTLHQLPGALAKLPPWLTQWGFRAASLGATLLAAVRTPLNTPGQLEHIQQFDARFDDLWQRAGIHTGGVRSAAYLNWRYGQHPLYRYRTLAWVEQGKLLGYITLTEREVFDIPAVFIVDALACPSAPKVLQTLIKHAASVTRATGHALMATQVIQGSTLQRAFAQAGLLTVPKRLCPKSFALTFHPLSGHAQQPALNRWHLTWGDMDVV